MEKIFVYMVSDEDYSPIFVLEAEEPFISNLKDGKTFRYIKDESELSVYVKKFPNVKFMYQTEVEQKKAYSLSDLFGLEKLWFYNQPTVVIKLF